MTETRDTQAAPADDAPADPFIHLGSAVALTRNQENGTVDDGEIHGAYRLMERPK